MADLTFEETVLRSFPTGSRYICNPPPTDTDNDTVILVNGFHDWKQLLLDDGWAECGKEYANHGEFEAFRKGEENYIVTEDPEFFQKYVTATEAAKDPNLTNKDDRIKLFQAVQYASQGFYGLTRLSKDRLAAVYAGPVAEVADWRDVF